MARHVVLASFAFLLTFGCGVSSDTIDPVDTDVELAEKFVSSFYSWDEEALRSLVGAAEGSDSAWYYQKWAHAAHYAVQERRPCEPTAIGGVSCAITVTDDFGTALGYTATDTFFLSIVDGEIASVRFEGDDPPIFEDLFDWMAEHRAEVFANECKDMFEGGRTPADCAVAVATAAREFRGQADSSVQPEAGSE